MKNRSTTIICVKRDKKIVLMADSQVTSGYSIAKDDINKLRTLSKEGNVIGGFAGTVSDCFTLTSMLKEELKESSGDLQKAMYALVKGWRTKEFKHLHSDIITADKTGSMYLVDGTGLIITPSKGKQILTTGSGGHHAYAAALTLMRNTNLDAKRIAHEAMKIASEICVFTNDKYNTLEIDIK